MDRRRNKQGRYVEQVTLGDVRSVLIDANEPVTATEVGERLSITNRAALNKLNELRDTGDVRRKQAGASAVVWWLARGEDEDTAESAFARRLSRKSIAEQYSDDYFGSNPGWADDLPDLGENA
jgi:predicted ArsR family transcriptional regulator